MKRLSNYLFKDNLICVLFLGICPMLLSLTTFEISYIMGFIVFAIILLDSLIFSMFNKIISNDMKIPIHIIITSIIILLIQLLLNSYIISLKDIYVLVLPLLVVNTILLNNIEQGNRNFKNSAKLGLIFLIIISLFGIIKELLGTGTITVMDKISSITGYKEILKVFTNDILISKLFTTNGGTLILLGIILGIINNLKRGEEE